jgi:rhodanese-related sulfurtransferase
MSKLITREEIVARQKAGEKLILVEALPERYFNTEHLPGAININHDQIEALAALMLPDKNSVVVTYCANAQCNNSAIAANKLERLGYTNVYKYEAGKQDWIEAGLPIESIDKSSAA